MLWPEERIFTLSGKAPGRAEKGWGGVGWSSEKVPKSGVRGDKKGRHCKGIEMQMWMTTQD